MHLGIMRPEHCCLLGAVHIAVMVDGLSQESQQTQLISRPQAGRGHSLLYLSGRAIADQARGLTLCGWRWRHTATSAVELQIMLEVRH